MGDNGPVTKQMGVGRRDWQTPSSAGGEAQHGGCVQGKPRIGVVRDVLSPTCVLLPQFGNHGHEEV